MLVKDIRVLDVRLSVRLCKGDNPSHVLCM